MFTTRPDTLFGATYLVLAPEHDLVDRLVAAQWPDGTDPRWTYDAATPAQAVAAYRKAIAAKSDLERQENKTKTGVFLGSYATNPANGEQVPVFIADYVLAGYGTGAIMAVPGHDQRDWEFAREFGLPIVEVIAGGDISEAAYTGDGVLVNSGYLDGMSVAARQGGHHRAAGIRRPRPGPHRIQAARLAFRAATLLGRTVPDRLRQRRARTRAGRRDAAGGTARRSGLFAGAVRPRRRRQRAVAAAGQGDRLGATSNWTSATG